MQIDFSNLNDTLKWLMDAGVAAVAAAFILERLAWFQMQAASRKSWIVFGGSLVVQLTAYGLTVYILPALPEQVLLVINGLWITISGTVVIFIGTQVGHVLVNKLPKSLR